MLPPHNTWARKVVFCPVFPASRLDSRSDRSCGSLVQFRDRVRVRGHGAPGQAATACPKTGSVRSKCYSTIIYLQETTMSGDQPSEDGHIARSEVQLARGDVGSRRRKPDSKEKSHGFLCRSTDRLRSPSPKVLCAFSWHPRSQITYLGSGIRHLPAFTLILFSPFSSSQEVVHILFRA